MKPADLSVIRPTVQRMSPYVPGEQPQGGGYIKLNTNENPYPPSPRVLSALVEAVGENLRRYPDPMAAALRRRAAETYGVDADGILAGNGSDELLSLLLRACVDAGDSVAYPVPTYSLYDTLATLEDAKIVHLPYTCPAGRLPAGLGQSGARITFVCHPNAPTGIAVDLAEIDRLAGEVAGLLVVDEAYVDFAEATALPLLARHENLVVLRTFSKSFSLAGMRIGLAFASPRLIGELVKVKDSYNLNQLSICAGTAALEDYAWMQANVAKIKATRTRLIEGLRRLGFEVADSQTNFVLARRPGQSQAATYQSLKEKKILVRYFSTPELFDALRITVGTDAEINALLEALASIG